MRQAIPVFVIQKLHYAKVIDFGETKFYISRDSVKYCTIKGLVRVTLPNKVAYVTPLEAQYITEKWLKY